MKVVWDTRDEERGGKMISAYENDFKSSPENL